MIPIIFTIVTGVSFYMIAKKKGASKIKWATIGALIGFVPITVIPVSVILLTGRPDLDGLSIMGAVVFVIFLSSIVTKQIKPKQIEK